MILSNKMTKDFTGFAKVVVIKGQSFWDRKVYFLIGTDLITATSKRTKAQQESNGGKGSVTRFRLNGKAISCAELEDHLKDTKETEFLYSSNVYELKAIRTERENAPVVEKDEDVKSFTFEKINVSINNTTSKITYTINENSMVFDINKTKIDQFLTLFFDAENRADVMVMIIERMNSKNKTNMFL